MCAMLTILFLGGWLPHSRAAVHLDSGRDLVRAQIELRVLHVRHGEAFVPRYRYDQLMRLGWKVFLPISLAMVAIVRRAANHRWAPK